MNLAARLESANKSFGTGILVSGETLALIRPGFISRELGRIVVRGKTRPVVIHELLAEGGDPSVSAKWAAHELYARGLGHFYGARFAQAQAHFSDAASRFEDPAARFMVEQCETFRIRLLGANWNGSIELATK